MNSTQLTPLQRFAAYGRGDSIDRLPCVPIIGNSSARLIGAKISAFRGNGPLIAEAQIAAYRAFNYDVIRVFTDLYQMGEAMGATVHYPEDETAYLDAPAIKSVEEIGSLSPLNPWSDGNLPAHLEAMKRVVDVVGAEVPVTGAVTCPFTTASFLIGAETLALESALRYAEAIISTGASPSLTDPMSSTTVISPRLFREFSFPYLKRLIDYIHSRGKSVTLHICGKTAKIWESMVDAGADCLSIDNEASLLDAKHVIGDKARIMGNVRPSEIMLQGTPAHVRQAVIACIAQAWDSPKGFIVASGCSLPTETPFDNIRAMMDTVTEIGWPICPDRLQALSQQYQEVL
jgi:uroporphyrinogen decarboxylase